MEDIQSILETIVLIIAVTGPIAGAVIGFIRNKLSCIAMIKEDIDEEKARSLRQSKGLIVIANRLDDINFEQHGKKLNLGPEMETILKDEKGHL